MRRAQGPGVPRRVLGGAEAGVPAQVRSQGSAPRRVEGLRIEGPHRGSKSMDRSSAGAEWVRAPTLMLSTPVAA